jgi:hypothetical protein
VTPLAWIVLACCCLFLAVVAVVVFGKDKYDQQIAAADATAPADLLHLAQLRDPGLEDYPDPHPDGLDDLTAIADAVTDEPATRPPDELRDRRRGRHHRDDET